MRSSVAGGVDEGEDHIVIDRRFASRDERTVLLDQACRPARGHDLRAGTVGRDVNLGAWEQSQRVSDRLGQYNPASLVNDSLPRRLITPEIHFWRMRPRLS